jgi:hypothetical protein
LSVILCSARCTHTEREEESLGEEKGENEIKREEKKAEERNEEREKGVSTHKWKKPRRSHVSCNI